MVWQAKTSLAELLRRRKQTLLEWMSQTGMTKLEEIQAWCEANGAILDLELPAVMKPTAPRVLPKPQAQLVVDTVKELADPSKLEAPPVSNVEEIIKIPDLKSDKKKISKKEENDPSSGSD